jgi:hypothetical protein
MGVERFARLGGFAAGDVGKAKLQAEVEKFVKKHGGKIKKKKKTRQRSRQFQSRSRSRSIAEDDNASLNYTNDNDSVIFTFESPARRGRFIEQYGAYMKSLEERLGVRLLSRTTRSVSGSCTPTRNGRGTWPL